MTIIVTGNGARVGPGSWLARLLQRPHPDTFICGTRWPDAEEPRVSRRWRYRRAWVDPYRTDDVCTIGFADKTRLRVRLDATPVGKGDGPPVRPGYVVLSCRTVEGSAVLLAVPPRELSRFGLDTF